jgi:hypothetical protein
MGDLASGLPRSPELHPIGQFGLDTLAVMCSPVELSQSRRRKTSSTERTWPALLLALPAEPLTP